MKIEIVQSGNGTDIVTLNGEAVSAAVSAIVLDAVARVETQQYAEAAASYVEEHCSFCQKELAADNITGFCDEGCYYAYTEGGSEEDQYGPHTEECWGPEDGGCCPCGSPSCDGTCGHNTPF